MKTKLVLLLILTLIIGFVIGWLTSAQVRLHKLQPVRMYLSDDRFREGFYKMIQPDEKQKAEIEEILDRYAKHNSGFQQDIRKNIDSSMKAFRKELDSKLTKEQLARLKEMDDKRQEMIRQNMRSRQEGYDRDHQRRPYSGERQGPPPPPADSIQ
ncbi:MAG: hypothetical protein V1903_01405 [Bacteroidota bacterium]